MTVRMGPRSSGLILPRSMSSSIFSADSSMSRITEGSESILSAKVGSRPLQQDYQAQIAEHEAN